MNRCDECGRFCSWSDLRLEGPLYSMDLAGQRLRVVMARLLSPLQGGGVVISFTVTLYLWWLWAYLAVGVALWLPVLWVARWSTSPVYAWWPSIRREFRTWRWLLGVALWPLVLWEVGPSLPAAIRRRRKFERTDALADREAE